MWEADLPFPMILHRNHVKLEYCPVFHLLLWLKLSGIQSGPIFPRIVGERNYQTIAVAVKMKPITVIRQGYQINVWVDKDDESVGITSKQYDSMLSRVFVKAYENTGIAGFKKLTTHSLRKTSAKWAARCGQDINVVTHCGRWSENSTSVGRYVEEGQTEALYHLNELNQRDPIRKVWVFRPCLFSKSIK